MNTPLTFQSNLPSEKDLIAIRRKARELQAQHLKAIFGRIVAAVFGRDHEAEIRGAVVHQRS